MKTPDLVAIGIPAGPCAETAKQILQEAHPEGTYLALLSHSGSRGTGAQVAQHYSRLAQELHPELPKELSHLAWLDLATQAGQEVLGGDGADEPPMPRRITN